MNQVQIGVHASQDRCPIFTELKNCMDCCAICPKCSETPVYALEGCIIESLIKSKKVCCTFNHDNSQRSHLAWSIIAHQWKGTIEWGEQSLMIWLEQADFHLLETALTITL